MNSQHSTEKGERERVRERAASRRGKIAAREEKFK